MIKMEVDEQPTNEILNGSSNKKLKMADSHTNGLNATIAANRMMPMDFRAGLSLSEAILLGAGRSPLGIAFSNASAAGTSPILLTSSVPTSAANARTSTAKMTSPSSKSAKSALATTVNCPTPAVSNGTTASAMVSPPPAAPQHRRKSSAPLIGPNGQIQVDCLICSDRATGKHYGSISCDGCKGFFRRTIRKKHNYICRFNRGCVVDKNQRNSCRRCRFEKCLANGMRPEAVQLERDRIAATRRTSTNTDKITTTTSDSPQSAEQQKMDSLKEESAETNNIIKNCANCLNQLVNSMAMPPPSSSTPLSMSPASIELQDRNATKAEQQLQRLMDAERILRQHQQRDKAATATNGQENMAMGSPNSTTAMSRTATTVDVTDSMHQQLILLVEWAKQLEEFRRLPLRSQIALLRHFSAQHLVICAAYRSSMATGVDGNDALLLANDRCVPRDAPKIPDVNRVVARILDHLTAPMRRLHLEDREFVALKAVAFFDPMAKDIEPSVAGEVEETRQRILTAFEHQVTRVSAHRSKMPLRLANLLLLLPPLMAIGRDLVEEAQLAKLFGLANVDELMAELLLPEDAETRSYSRLRTSVTSSIVQSNVTSPTPPTTSPHRHQQQHHYLMQQQPSPLGTLVSSTAGSPQQQQIAAPTPIYSPATQLVIQIGSAAQQHNNLFGHFGGKRTG